MSTLLWTCKLSVEAHGLIKYYFFSTKVCTSQRRICDFFLLLSLNSLAQVCTHLSGLEITTILGPFSWLRIHYNFVPIFLGQNLLQFFAHISASEFIAILCPFFWVTVYCNFVTIFLGRNLLQFCDHEFIAILWPFFWVKIHYNKFVPILLEWVNIHYKTILSPFFFFGIRSHY